MKTSSLEFHGSTLPVIRGVAKKHSRRVDPGDFEVFLRQLWEYRVFDVRRAAGEAMLQFIKRGMEEDQAIAIISDGS
jgi:hypothetical protein